MSVGARKCRTSGAGDKEERAPLTATSSGLMEETDSYDGGTSVSGG